MNITALELTEPVEGGASILIGGSGDRERDEDLISVEAGVTRTEVAGLKALDRFDRLSRQQVDLWVDSRKSFERVEEHR